MNPVVTTVNKSHSSPRDKVMHVMRLVGLIVFILAIPTFLVTSNVRLAFSNLSLYRYGFEHYGVASTTGLTMTQLMDVARDIRHYFNSSQEYLDVTVVLSGEERPLFNLGEIRHMRDVKVLVNGVQRIQVIAVGFIITYLVVLLTASRGRNTRLIASLIMRGSLLTIVLVVFVGVALMLGFNVIFQQFHVLSFASGTWTFDPRYNYLTRLFTEGFFFLSTLFIAISVIVQALLLTAAGFGINKIASKLGRPS